jgi:hypothetical protein
MPLPRLARQRPGGRGANRANGREIIILSRDAHRLCQISNFSLGQEVNPVPPSILPLHPSDNDLTPALYVSRPLPPADERPVSQIRSIQKLLTDFQDGKGPPPGSSTFVGEGNQARDRRTSNDVTRRWIRILIRCDMRELRCWRWAGYRHWLD